MLDKRDKADFLNIVLQNTVEQARDIVVVFDIHGRVMYANHAAINAYGYSASEFYDILVYDLSPAKRRQMLDDKLKASGQERTFFRDVHVRRDGAAFPVEASFRRIRIAEQEAFVGEIRDISREVAEETVLKSTLEQYARPHKDFSIVDEAAAPQEELSAQARIIQCENAVFALLHETALGLANLDPDEVLKKIILRATELFGTEHGFAHIADEEKGTFTLKIGTGVFTNLSYTGKITDGLMGRAYKTGRIAAVDDYCYWEYRLPEPIFDGLHYFTLVPLKNRDRTIGAIGLAFSEPGRKLADEEVSFFQRFADLASIVFSNAMLVASYKNEIEERKQAEEALRTSEEKYARIVHICPDAIAIVRLDGTFIEVNEGFCQMHGFAREEIIGRNSCELGLWADPQDRRVFIEDLKRQGVVINQEFRIRGKDGVIMDHVLSARMVNINGEDCSMNFAHDITERKRMEEALKNSEENYRTIFNAAHDAIYVHDAQTGEILEVNEKARALHGHAREEILADGLNFIGTGQSPYSRKEALQYLGKAAGGEPQIFEWQIKHKDGHDKWVEVSLQRTTIGHKERVLAIVRDISERKKAEMELHKTQASNQALINAIPDMMFVLKRDGTFVDFKGRREELYVPAERFIGKSVHEVFPAEIAVQIMRAVKDTAEKGIQIFECKLPIQGKIQHYEARLVVSGEDEVLAISRNITERKRMEEQLKKLSLHDALTGLYNRAFFEEEMKRRMSEKSMGLLICDVDGLKVINDTLGHDTGDVILKTVANTLSNSFRPEDVIARIGGDEFAVILRIDSVRELASIHRRVREQIECYNVGNQVVPISLSMGYAVSNQSPANMGALFKEADDNMYREKLHQQKSARSAIVQALMKALEARDFLTEGHGDRLQDLVQSFAEVIGLPEHSIADIRLFAHFHDIGKVGIPDSILFKAGRLTDEEWVVMRRHCEIGYRIAISTPDLAPIAEWILKHQEWWNGRGYPLGLREREIPLECRMLAIVDAFDAMTSDRPYRKALSKSAAIAELRRCAGTQFDPELVEKFCLLKDTEL